MRKLPKTSKAVKIDGKLYRQLSRYYSPDSVEFKAALLKRIKAGKARAYSRDNGETINVERVTWK